MNLNQASLKDKALWEKAGITLPQFDRDEMIRKTTEAPVWIHFGAGNIFRGFPAALQQNLLNKGLCDKGIVVAEGFDCEIIDKAYKPFDNLSLLVVLKADGSIDKEVIASVAQSLRAGTDAQDDPRLLFPQSVPPDGKLHHHRKGLRPDEFRRAVPAVCGAGFRPQDRDPAGHDGQADTAVL